MTTHDTVSLAKVIRKWWWVIFLLFVATVGTMAGIAYFSETRYRATVTLQVSAPAPQEVPLYSQFGRGALRDEIEQTQGSFSEFLQEGNVVWEVVRALPDIPVTGEDLRKSLEIEIPENSQLMYVRVTAKDSENAALLANTLVDIGLQDYGKLLAQGTIVTRQFIEQQLLPAREAVEKAGTELTQFQIANKIGGLNGAIDSHQQLIRSLQIQSDLARADGDLVRARSLEEIILEREAELQNILGLIAIFTDLNNRYERARSTYNFLLDKQTEAQIKENQILEVGSIQIITPARPPDHPVAAITPTLIALGAVASIMAGIVLALLLEYLNISRPPYDVQQRAISEELKPAPDRAG